MPTLTLGLPWKNVAWRIRHRAILGGSENLLTGKTSCDFGGIENPVAKIGTRKVQTLTGSSSKTTTAIDLLSSDLGSEPRNWPSLWVSLQSATKSDTCHFDPSRKNYVSDLGRRKNPKLRKSHRRPQVLFITLCADFWSNVTLSRDMLENQWYSSLWIPIKQW